MSSTFIHPTLQNRYKLYLKQKCVSMLDYLDIHLSHIDIKKIMGTMPVNERTIQPFGILHGGASVVLAETLSSVGSFLHIQEDDVYGVGIDINASHIRQVSKNNIVQGIAKAVHIGRRTHVWETELYHNKKLICLSRCTLAIIYPQKKG